MKVALCCGAVIHFPPLRQNTEDLAGGRFLGVCPGPKGKRSLVRDKGWALQLGGGLPVNSGIKEESFSAPINRLVNPGRPVWAGGPVQGGAANWGWGWDKHTRVQPEPCLGRQTTVRVRMAPQCALGATRVPLRIQWGDSFRGHSPSDPFFGESQTLCVTLRATLDHSI